MHAALKCCRCGERFWLEPETEAQLRRSETVFHCPWGHPQHFLLGETEETKIRRERDRLVQQAARLQDELKDARRRIEASAGVVKVQAAKLRRVGQGVCPCCNRSFANLRRHIAMKHPEREAA